MVELVEGDAEQVFPILENVLKDNSEKPALRYLVAEKLRGIDNEKATQVFREILNDRKLDVFARRTAITQLVSTNAPDTKERMRDVLTDKTEDPAMRQYALGIYSSWNERGKIEKLRQFVQSKDENLGIRMDALFLLQESEDFDFLRSELHRFLGDKREAEELRKGSMLIAQKMGDKDLLPTMTRVAQDREESFGMRQSAISMLGEMGNESTASILEAMLRNEPDQKMIQTIRSAVASIKKQGKNRIN